MIDFSGFREAMVANAEGIETQRRVDAVIEKKALQLAVEQERRARARADARREQQRRYEDARREQERLDRIVAREKLQQLEQEQREEDEAKEQANKALLFFMAKKKVFLEAFDKLKTAAEAEAIRNPRLEDACVELMKKTGKSVTSLSDMSRIVEQNSLKRLADDFIEEHEMSPRTRQYFMRMVAPLLMPRPRREIDDITDLMKNMARAGAGRGNQDLASALLPKLITDISPGLQASPEQNFQLSYQPQVAQLQVKQCDPISNLEHVKNRAESYGFVPKSQPRESVQDRKMNGVVEQILKNADIPSLVRAHKASKHA